MFNFDNTYCDPFILMDEQLCHAEEHAASHRKNYSGFHLSFK
jgi:hypothetical protein